MSDNVVRDLYTILFSKEEESFRNTLKRTCYILINNWSSSRKYECIQQLIETISEAPGQQSTFSRMLGLLRTWLANFVNSADYQELQVLTENYTPSGKKSWHHRYSSFLLVPQYLNLNNPREQRELTRNLANKLKQKFRFELVMYSIHETNDCKRKYKNPTTLGNDAIAIIKKIVSKNIDFSYKNYARIFLKETENISYHRFKESLYRYLTFGIQNTLILNILQRDLLRKFEGMYESRDRDSLDFDLLLRTCRQTIEFFTTEDSKSPSQLFIALAAQDNPLTIAIILLKIILICKYVRAHLDICIAKLILYYENFSEQECQWFINFLEVFNIVFAIYTENIQYDLVKVEDCTQGNVPVDMKDYRIFPQLKSANLRSVDLSSIDLRGQDLSSADLREANLSSSDLSQAKLSLAKLNFANLNGVLLKKAELFAATLQNALLKGASLNEANLRRAELQKANLTGANLSDAILTLAKLEGANLSFARLNRTDLARVILNNANLSHADLSHADLSHADLSHADLSHANLSHANLSNANLSHANLSNANLSHGNLNSTLLNKANCQNAILRHAILDESEISHANLSHADLSYASVVNTNMSHSNFSNGFLRHVRLHKTNLSYAKLNGTNLFKAKFNYGACVKNAQFMDNAGLSERQRGILEKQEVILE
ncbi:pentapeptide repeat-containing protein [Lusitaniella coriacea]|uniref:pentapeptide repeat-containing protein n=1 Tax=Lusitaniella coriacea TaxID=1983105 RepID=UPI003CFA21E3